MILNFCETLNPKCLDKKKTMVCAKIIITSSFFSSKNAMIKDLLYFVVGDINSKQSFYSCSFFVLFCFFCFACTQTYSKHYTLSKLCFSQILSMAKYKTVLIINSYFFELCIMVNFFFLVIAFPTFSANGYSSVVSVQRMYSNI